MKKKILWTIVIDISISILIFAIMLIVDNVALDFKEIGVAIGLSAIFSIVYLFMISYSDKKGGTSSQVAVFVSAVMLLIFLVFTFIQSLRDARFLELLTVLKAPFVAITVFYLKK
jgi:hypothetical protein